MLEGIDPTTIEDSANRQLVVTLLNLLENAMHQVELLKTENQSLRDEINRLKGEQTKPDIKPPTAGKDYSARQHYRRSPKKDPAKGSKNSRLVVTRTEKLLVDRQTLPKDALFKGYESVIVQEVIFRPEVICYQKEKFYSPSERITYLAPLPQGFKGQFGPGLVALVLQLYYQAGLSEPKLHQLLTTFGFEISPAQISAQLIQTHQASFLEEKQALTKAGLAATTWQHFDHTSTRGRGRNLACHILCSSYYTVFTTLEKKDRLSIVRVLLGGSELSFTYNSTAAHLLEEMGLPNKWRKTLAKLAPQGWQSQAELEGWLSEQLPKLNQAGRKLVIDALAIAAYQAQSDWPVVRTLICDDAPQFNYLTPVLALCWIHEARPYTKLEPKIAYHATLLTAWLGEFWRLYDSLLLYSQFPTSSQKELLAQRFEEVFRPGGEYQQLDAQIEKSRAKRNQLLAVLEQPGLPLHNNPAELGARQRVRKLDVSLAVFTQKGLAAWDTLQTVVATCLKLGVNVYHYLYDRLSGKRQLPSLATLIEERSRAGPPVSYYPSEKSLNKSRVARAKHQVARKGKAGSPPKVTSTLLPVPTPPKVEPPAVAPTLVPTRRVGSLAMSGLI